MLVRLLCGVAFLPFVSLPAGAADVVNYALIKNRSQTQPDASTVVLSTNDPFTFVAVVQANTNNVSGATLQLPDTSVRTFTNTPGFGPFGIAQGFASQLDMDSVFANGSYQFTINAVHDGTRMPTLTLTGDAYPNSPTVTNYDAAQLIAGTNFTLRWTPFTGGGAGDNIVVTVDDSSSKQVFASPIFGQAGALNGTATSVVVTNLKVGNVYSARLTFAKIASIDPISYPGVPGITVYAASTDFRMRTLSVPLLTITNTPASEAQLSFNSDSGRNYDIRATVDFTNWVSLLVTNAASSNVIYTDASAPGFIFRAYRLQNP